MFMKILFLIGCLAISLPLSAQEKDLGEGQIWDSRLANHYTASMPQSGQTSIYFGHYFLPITEKGFDNFFGIVGSENLQLGLEYGITDNFSARYTTEKLTKSQELGMRYRFVQENHEENIPVSLAVDFSVSLDARDEKYFGENFYFVNRFFYTTQIIVSKQIGSRSLAMVNGTIAHLNIVPDSSFSTFFSLNPSFAYRATQNMAVFCALDLPLGIASAAEETPQDAKALLTLGAIFRTQALNFQLFATNGTYINPAKEYLNNYSGISMKAMRFVINLNVKLGTKKQNKE